MIPKSCLHKVARHIKIIHAKLFFHHFIMKELFVQGAFINDVKQRGWGRASYESRA